MTSALSMQQSQQTAEGAPPRANAVMMDLQETSPLFRLPLELRHQIYGFVFQDVQLHCQCNVSQMYHQGNCTDGCVWETKHPLMRTCRRATDDIGNDWLSHITVKFDHSLDMLAVLIQLPTEKLCKLRDLSVGSDILTIWPRPSGRCEHYSLAAVLKLLPGLRLDGLRVTYDYEDFGDHDRRALRVVEELVKQGNGWKELIFKQHPQACWASQHDQAQILRYASDLSLCADRLDSFIKERDGGNSHAGATVWHHGRQLTSGHGHTNGGETVSGDYEAGEYEDGHVCAATFTIKRGRWTDYEEKANSPLLSSDIRLYHAKLWEDVQRGNAEAISAWVDMYLHRWKRA